MVFKKQKNKITQKQKNKPSKTVSKISKGHKKIQKKVLGKTQAKKVSKKSEKKSLKLLRSNKNPIIEPSSCTWESQAVFNPAAIDLDGKIHLFYRAMGDDGISRIGYASSKDGITFNERLPYPVYFVNNAEELKKHWPYTSPLRPVYDKVLYASGGGWGGCEDPRAVSIDGKIYLTINMFNGWNSMRVAVICIDNKDLLEKKWVWKFSYLSKEGDRQKNWVLFPEKIKGKFVIFHNLDKGDSKRVGISYLNKLDPSEAPSGKEALDPHTLPDHLVAWHKRTRSAASPPIKTKDGWLLLYHAMDKENRYKLGALLLDLKDPEKVLYRAQAPILEPDLWYENDWKKGIIYASGAIVKDGKLMVYYGGGDKHIALAWIKLSDLIESMKENKNVKLQKKSLIFK